MDKTKYSFETWCPLFEGFYYSDSAEIVDHIVHDLGCNKDCDYEGSVNCTIGNNLTEYWKIQEEVQEAYGEEFCKRLSELTEGVVTFEYQSISSPKQYNFESDYLNVVAHIHKPFTILSKIVKHEGEFDEYIAQHYTSRDGFISHYPNKGELWRGWVTQVFENPEAEPRCYRVGCACTLTHSDKSFYDRFKPQHCIGRVLDFYCLLLIDPDDFRIAEFMEEFYG